MLWGRNWRIDQGGMMLSSAMPMAHHLFAAMSFTSSVPVSHWHFRCPGEELLGRPYLSARSFFKFCIDCRMMYVKYADQAITTIVLPMMKITIPALINEAQSPSGTRPANHTAENTATTVRTAVTPAGIITERPFIARLLR